MGWIISLEQVRLALLDRREEIFHLSFDISHLSFTEESHVGRQVQNGER